MAAMKIDNPQSLKLLPQFMRKDEANIALSKAVDILIKNPGERVKQLRIWDQIDHLSGAILDELAWEMDIDWWKDSWDEETKRRTLKTAHLIKRRRGTVGAVQAIITNLFGDSQVEEWYGYGSKPHHFKIVTNHQPNSFDSLAEFKELLRYAKMASAVLDAVEFVTEEKAKEFVITAYAAGEITDSCTTPYHYIVSVSSEGKVITAIAATGHTDSATAVAI